MQRIFFWVENAKKLQSYNYISEMMMHKYVPIMRTWLKHWGLKGAAFLLSFLILDDFARYFLSPNVTFTLSRSSFFSLVWLSCKAKTCQQLEEWRWAYMWLVYIGIDCYHLYRHRLSYGLVRVDGWYLT